MKKIFTGFLLLLVQISFGQDCNTQAANKPSVYTRGQDFYDDMLSDRKNRCTNNLQKVRLGCKFPNRMDEFLK